MVSIRQRLLTDSQAPVDSYILTCSSLDLFVAIEDTVQRFLAANNEDKEIQSEKVMDMVNDLSKNPANKGKNILIFHDQSSEVKLKNLAHYHVELDKLVGGTKGYEIMIFDEGEFTLHGDAGWLNWGFAGCGKRDGPEGKHVVFSRCS